MRIVYFFLFLLFPIYKIVKKAVLLSNLKMSGVRCASTAVFHVDDFSKIEFGHNVSVAHGAIIIVSDEKSSPDIKSSLMIGSGSAINEYANIRAAGGHIKIGQNCMIAQFVSMVASNHMIDSVEPMINATWDSRRTDIIIGDDVWIGASSIILPGVHVGSGSVIAAGAVVTKDVAAGQVVAGVPAKLVRMRKTHE